MKPKLKFWLRRIAYFFYRKIYLNPRRYYFLLFDRERIIKSLESRKGKCNHCGECCRHMRLTDCKYLSKNGKCKIFSSPRQKVMCDMINYPWEEKDLPGHLKNVCGFYWDKNVEGGD